MKRSEPQRSHVSAHLRPAKGLRSGGQAQCQLFFLKSRARTLSIRSRLRLSTPASLEKGQTPPADEATRKAAVLDDELSTNSASSVTKMPPSKEARTRTAMPPLCGSTRTSLAPSALSARCSSSAALAALFGASHPQGTISPLATALAAVVSVCRQPGSFFSHALGVGTASGEEDKDDDDDEKDEDEEDEEEDEEDLARGGAGGAGGGLNPKNEPIASFCARFAASK